jgi:hypothetical protein
VILAVLAFGTDVDHLVKFGQLCYGSLNRRASAPRLTRIYINALAHRIRVFISG